MKPFQIGAILEGINLLKERGCLSIRFHSQELTKEELASVTDYHQEFGYLLFKPNVELEDSEIPTDNASYEGKTPSQRLKNILYAYSKRAQLQGDFESFYRKQLEILCNKWKDKIDLICPECHADTESLNGKCTCKAGDSL